MCRSYYVFDNLICFLEVSSLQQHMLFRAQRSAIDDRVKLLLDLFRRSHNSFAVPALGDVIHYVQAAISNFQGEGQRRLRDNELEMSRMDNRTPRFLKRQEGVVRVRPRVAAFTAH